MRMMALRAAAVAAITGFVVAAPTHALQTTALAGATVIDGTGAAPVADGVVIVRDGRIECVGTRSACAVPQGATTVDVRGRWIMPGIVDAHVHYSQTGWADGRPDALDMRERFPYEQTIAYLKDPTPIYRANLCSGVTATFDVGGFPWTWRLRQDAERSTSAPHVAAAGPLLSTRDHWLNMPAERQFMHIGTDSAVTLGAKYLIANRTDAIKVWFLAGANSPDSADWVRRIMMAGAAARDGGVPLIVHATSLWQAKHALRAGAKLLVHGVTDQPVDDEFLALAKQAGTVYTPTLVVNDGYAQLRARNFAEEKYGNDLRCVDPVTLGKAFLTDSLPGAPTAAVLERTALNAARRLLLERANVRAVHEAGIPVAMGTDAGNPLTLHGPSVFLEMQALQDAGLSPGEVIVASTRNSARAMGRTDIGTLQRGSIADLIVLTADPTQDIANARRIERVMRGGRLQQRSELMYR